MKNSVNKIKVLAKALCGCLGLLLVGCDQFEADVVPAKFAENIRIHSDNIYLYRNSSKIRLDHFINDTLPSYENITYSAPLHGKFATFFEADNSERLGYIPDENFVGKDSITYQVCVGSTCKTATIRLYIEELIDLNTCKTVLGADVIETRVNTPVEIRYFFNDTICPGSWKSIESRAPKLGTAYPFSYSGMMTKNNGVFYYPPKNYRGTDSFIYRVYPIDSQQNGEYLEVEVIINIK